MITNAEEAQVYKYRRFVLLYRKYEKLAILTSGSKVIINSTRINNEITQVIVTPSTNSGILVRLRRNETKIVKAETINLLVKIKIIFQRFLPISYTIYRESPKVNISVFTDRIILQYPGGHPYEKIHYSIPDTYPEMIKGELTKHETIWLGYWKYRINFQRIISINNTEVLTEIWSEIVTIHQCRDLWQNDEQPMKILWYLVTIKVNRSTTEMVKKSSKTNRKIQMNKKDTHKTDKYQRIPSEIFFKWQQNRKRLLNNQSNTQKKKVKEIFVEHEIKIITQNSMKDIEIEGISSVNQSIITLTVIVVISMFSLLLFLFYFCSTSQWTRSLRRRISRKKSYLLRSF